MNELEARKLGYIQPINWLMKIVENLREFRNKKGVISEIEVTNPVTREKFLVRALWDTGATFTCLSSALVEKMGLKPVGSYELHMPTFTTSVNKYDITLKIDPKRTAHYQVKAGTFEVAPDFDVILGLDILINGRLTMWVEDGVFNFEFIENIYK